MNIQTPTSSVEGPVAHVARILVVDDDKSIRLTLRAILQDAGYEADVANDATQAQALLSKNAYDVVVTDIILPDVSGVELLKAIRAAAPAVQVIMMTGEPSVETAAEAVHAGASDYLTKPVGKNAILRSVANAIRLKAIDDERRQFIDTLAARSAELEELARRRKMLLHLMRHDIANAVSGAIALLEREKTTIQQYAGCDQAILAMLVHCEGVIQDVRAREMESLAVSGPQAATLRSLVEEACTVLGAQAGAKGVTIVADVNPDIRVQVRPGPFVVHVLNNILRNAIKFSYPGGVIKVSAKAEVTEVSVAFRDSGCGIPQSRLGDLFERTSTTVGTAGEIGTGYGLRHVRECLQEIGGNIDIESVCRADGGTGSVESGTTVTLRVPRAVE